VIHGERIDAYRYDELTQGSRCTIVNAWRVYSGITVKGLHFLADTVIMPVF